LFFHAGGCPVIRGNKWSSTKWMRVNEYKAWNTIMKVINYNQKRLLTMSFVKIFLSDWYWLLTVALVLVGNNILRWHWHLFTDYYLNTENSLLIYTVKLLCVSFSFWVVAGWHVISSQIILVKLKISCHNLSPVQHMSCNK
jgi:hypothetical protein